MERRKTNEGVRKRAPNACSRCRKQKIKCTGSLPCDQCSKRNLVCDFDDQAQKVLVAKGYINDLQKRLASFERVHSQDYSVLDSVADLEESRSVQGSGSGGDVNRSLQLHSEDGLERPNTAPELLHHHDDGHIPDPDRSGTNLESSRASPIPQLMNPLALGYSAYISAHTGELFYLGTSSNWAFCRRVLAMTHERVFQAPPPADNLLYEGRVYDLGLDNQTTLLNTSELDPSTLPSADFATYLIDAVKFHCGQFHLFDEDNFMQHFERYHDPSVDKTTVPHLWYIHYLFIIAFGKAFIVRMNRGGRPPGADFFIQAMKLLPNATLLCVDPVETIEILCCAALYSHSLDFRSLAYRLIGQAFRLGLTFGMHTSMQSQHVDRRHVERCRKAWWTTYMLDRQMSALMGVPMAIRDEDISADLPTLPGSPQKVKALDLHIKLSRVIAKIFNTIYGAEVNLDKRLVENIKAALVSVAAITDELNGSFPISTTGSMAGVTRRSAYLHLLQHQCILLAIRPLLFTFLDMRLNSADMTRSPVPHRGNIRALLHMCVESAQQILRLLSGLQEQGLLESFLPFDLDPTFTAAIVSLMMVAVDPRILSESSPWTDMAFTILDEMICRGNLIAAFLKSELQQLEGVLVHLPPITHHSRRMGDNAIPRPRPRSDPQPQDPQNSTAEVSYPTSETQPSTSDDFSVPDIDWNTGVNTEHLMMVADSLDLDGFDWLSHCFVDIPNHGDRIGENGEQL